MAKKRFTVVINGDFGYSDYQVKAVDWKQAKEIARVLHLKHNPEDRDVGYAAVIAGWPAVWC